MNSQRTAPPAHRIHDLITRRWSPYAFSQRVVSNEDLRALFEAACWAASSYNEQPWRYIVATKSNAGVFKRLLSCLVETNQAWPRSAPVLALGSTSLYFALDNKSNAAAIHDIRLAGATRTLEATSRGLFDIEILESRPSGLSDFITAFPRAGALGYRISPHSGLA